MMTLRKFLAAFESVPASTAWYLSDIAEARGRQDLFARQSPQRLEALRQHALIESAVSSSRIEGVEIEPSRVEAVILGNAPLRDRDEEEVQGYRKALDLVHGRAAALPVSEKTIRTLHRLVRGRIWDAGRYKTEDSDIIEKLPGGRSVIRFRTVPARRTPQFMKELLKNYRLGMKEQRVPPLILVAAFNLDFLCIHPFRDGNGRVSRLLLLLQCYHVGLEVGRYISLERLIEESKDRYYETLKQSSRGWHQGKHDPWPYINYILFIIRRAYMEFEERLGRVTAPRGMKTAMIERAIAHLPAQFTLVQVERACPGISREMIRRVLRRLRDEGRLECLRRGPGALWRKKGNTLKRG